LLVLLAETPWLIKAEYNAPVLEQLQDERTLAKRYEAIEKRLAQESPVGVRKMSRDPDEMFFLEYWQFEDGLVEGGDSAQMEASHIQSKKQNPAHVARPEGQGSEAGLANLTSLMPIQPPLLLHSEMHFANELAIRFFARSMFTKRDYNCPAGTGSCSNIGRPNSCCESGSTCILVQDVGLGDVGCCAAGTNCGGRIAACDVADGYTSCPNSENNGGCCIPNYVCDNIGCEWLCLSL